MPRQHTEHAFEVAIKHLQEYRTALITAAVTGKIDVREAVTDTIEGERN